MQYIEKGREPKSMIEKKIMGIQSFDDLDKTDIRTALIREQKYLCCYCSSRIMDDRSKVRIEHWYPESVSKDEGDFEMTIDYSNLLLACCGGKGRHIHCDRKKGNKKITINPQKKHHIQKIKYTKNGVIYSDDPAFDDDITSKLNLNTSHLKINRATIYDIVKLGLSKRDGLRTKAELEKMISKWRTYVGDGKHKEQYKVAEFFILKKLKKYYG